MTTAWIVYLGNVEIGDRFRLAAQSGPVSGNVEYVATEATVANVLTGLAAAWNAHSVLHTYITATANLYPSGPPLNLPPRITLASTFAIPYWTITPTVLNGGAVGDEWMEVRRVPELCTSAYTRPMIHRIDWTNFGCSGSPTAYGDLTLTTFKMAVGESPYGGGLFFNMWAFWGGFSTSYCRDGVLLFWGQVPYVDTICGALPACNNILVFVTDPDHICGPCYPPLTGYSCTAGYGGSFVAVPAMELA